MKFLAIVFFVIGCSWICQAAKPIGAADATFTVSASNGCINTPEVFTQTTVANSVSWSWNFGAGAVPQTSSTPGPHAVYYTSSGPKIATLTVGNGTTSQTKNVNFTINLPPTSSFTFTGTTTSIPTTLIFNGNGCNSCDYNWNFGDTGTVDDISIKSQTTHTFNYDGAYFATLKITDPSSGCSTTSKQTITITGGSSIYNTNFTISPTVSTCVNSKVVITDMSNMPDKSRTWYFGQDAVPAIATNTDTATVYWKTAGIKTIELIAGQASGTNTQTIKTVYYQVTDYPDASFTFSGDTSTAPAAVSFTANESNGYSFVWDFGDPSSGSNTATSSRPIHTYGSAGVYTVSLAITHNGCTSYYATNVYVATAIPAIIPAFQVQPSKNGCQSPSVLVTDLSKGVVSSYAWQFGSGASPATASTKGPFSVSYSASGSKTLKITIGNGSITQSATMKIKVVF